MPRQTPKTTFVGPITKRAKSYSFLILQGGMDPIKLEYPTQMVARQSRAQLLETHHTYPVPSTKLLMAIQQALNEEHGTPLQQHPNAWDEATVPTLSPDDNEDSPAHHAQTGSRESPAGQNAESNQG